MDISPPPPSTTTTTAATTTITMNSDNYFTATSSPSYITEIRTHRNLDEPSSPSTPQQDFPSAADIAKDVVTLFLSGVAILLGLIVVVYGIALIFDRWCCCCPGSGGALLGFSHDGNDDDDDEQRRRRQRRQYVEGGEVARDAGLLGMTSEERRIVLEKVLVGKPFQKEMLFPTSTSSSSLSPTIDTNCTNDENNNDDDDDDGEHVQSSTLLEVSEKTEEAENDHVVLDVSDVGPIMPTREEEGKEDGERRGDIEEGLNRPPAQAEQTTDADDVFADVHHDTICAICINEYEEGEMVMTGTSCSHMFHKDCLLEWLDRHDVCPFCRKNMLTSEQMRDAAKATLGEERTIQLALEYDPRRMSSRERVEDRNRISILRAIGLSDDHLSLWSLTAQDDAQSSAAAAATATASDENVTPGQDRT